MKPSTRKRRKAKALQPDFISHAGGKIEIVQATFDNPFAYGSGNPVQKVTEFRNRKTSPIVEYSHRRTPDGKPLIHPCHREAGLEFERLYYLARATPSAMDMTKEPVDGGNFGDGITDSKIDAIKALSRLRDATGQQAYNLIEQVCGHHCYIASMSRNGHETTKLMHHLREALDAAALHWGYRRGATERR